eukprot:5490158-Amphidinium_carterae.1
MRGKNRPQDAITGLSKHLFMQSSSQVKWPLHALEHNKLYHVTVLNRVVTEVAITCKAHQKQADTA